VVDELLGPEVVAEEGRRRRALGVRLAAALAAIGLMVAVGLATTDTPHGKTLNGRTGPVYVP
jgi:hypothetical protein